MKTRLFFSFSLSLSTCFFTSFIGAETRRYGADNALGGTGTNGDIFSTNAQ